jgi:hypothetical protein
MEYWDVQERKFYRGLAMNAAEPVPGSSKPIIPTFQCSIIPIVSEAN